MESFEYRQTSCRFLIGPGRLAEIKGLADAADCRRVAWIVAEPLREVVRPVAAGAAVHAVPDGEPNTGTVEACHAFLRDAAPDLVVALGGGSTMDAAKAARMMRANDCGIEALAAAPTLRRPDSLFVCVPTTAGTGSEASEMAIISKTGSDVKLRLRSRRAMPDVAILDPELLVSLPKGPTAHTGFDAFTHALEAYCSRLASSLTDLLTLDAIARLGTWLPVAIEQPENIAARGQCLQASLQAALAFNNTELGLAHAIAAPLGAQHHVIHGLGNALALPVVAAFNEPALPEDKHRRLIDAMGSETVADGVAAFRAQIGLDLGLEACLPAGADYEAIAAAAMKSGNIASNPRRPRLDEVRGLLDAMRSPLAGASPHSLLSKFEQ